MENIGGVAKSFSLNAKDSAIRTWPKHEGCKAAEVAAAVQAAGSIVIVKGEISLEINVEHARFVRRLFSFIKEILGESPELCPKRNTRLKKGHSYIVTVHGQENCTELLKNVGVAYEHRAIKKIIPEEIKRSCCKRAYLRAMFILCASMSNPEKANHLEFAHKDENIIKAITEIMNAQSFKCGLSIRKDNYVAYIKDGAKISDFLAFIGANSAILKYENTRILKQTRNDVNRAANCISANVDKTVDAAQRQIACIRFLLKSNLFEKLSPVLKQTAEARLENPEVTIEELAQLVNPPVAKSGMNHRLRRLCEIAQKEGFEL